MKEKMVHERERNRREGTMQVALIAAFGRGMAIGKEGRMPWPRPGDLRRFKQLTLGKPVVMGRKTHESIGMALPGRTNIVLTHQQDYQTDGCLIAHSIAEVVEIVEELPGPEQMMICGGAEIYEQFLPRADRMYLTVVYHDFDGDAFFPGFASGEWLLEQRDDRGPDEDFEWPHTYFSLRRNRDKPMTARSQSSPSKLPDILAPIEGDALDFD